MSIWAKIEGTIRVRKDSRLSIKEAFNQHADELTYSSDTVRDNDYWVHHVCIAFCADGMQACKIVDAVVKYIKQQCKTASVDLNVSVRWFE